MRWGVAVFLAVAAPVLARAALTGPPITTSDYRVDLSHGPALGSTEEVGMGGADIALAHGAPAMDHNPAAVASPLPGASGRYDGDASLSSFVVGGRDFDNNGSVSTAYSRHVVTQGGGLFQAGAWGFGLFAVSQQYDAETGGLTRRLESVDSHILVGWRNKDGRVVWGGGIQTAEFKMTPKGESHKLLHLSGGGLETGLLWRPEGRPFRLGAAYHGWISDNPGASLPAGTVTRVDGLVVPRGVTLPSTFSLGAAYVRAGELPFTAAADVQVIGRAKEADGVEAFLEQTEQRSGRRATVSPRLGVQSECVPDRFRLRAGTYFEPSRFSGVKGRRHATAGFEARLFKVPFFGDRYLSVGYAFDSAPRYGAQFLSLGFWH